MTGLCGPCAASLSVAVSVRRAELSGSLTLFREAITSGPFGGIRRVAHPVTVPLLAAPAQAFGIDDARATTATALVFHVSLDWFLKINMRTLGRTRRIRPAQVRAAKAAALLATR